MTRKLEVLETSAAARRSVIATLERAIEEARSGDALAVALVIIRPNNVIGTAWSNGHLTSMAGGVALLQKRLLDEV